LVIHVRIEKISQELELPVFANPGDVVVDLRSSIYTTFSSQKIKGTPTDFAIELPKR